jgi:hypothetical protein
LSDVVAVFAVLGALIEYLAVLAGPQLATIGTAPDAPLPAMDPVPFAIALIVTTLSIVGAVAVVAGRSARRWGVVLMAAAVVGSLAAASSSGIYILGAIFTLSAGVMALFIRPGRGVPRR